MNKQIAEPAPRPIPNMDVRLRPSDKQQLFLNHRHVKEVFFGGAAGGGKSVALLMGAYEYTQVPAYSALILRKDLARMELAGGLIWRSHEWFRETDARWIASRKQWIFPNLKDPDEWPATIMFGYLKSPLDKYRYASSEFQYIAFDELTDFTEEDYLFLFSRLRRNTSTPVPLRIRSASNPGGPGHLWVKERFVSGGAEVRIETTVRSKREPDRNIEGTAFEKQGRLYLPSRIADNPGLDEAEYRETLLHLPPVVREQLMNGDWSVQEDGVFKPHWLRYYDLGPGQYELLKPDGGLLRVVPQESCRRFITIDPAGTSADRTREKAGRGHSFTVLQVWDWPTRELDRYLILRHQVRRQVAFNDLCNLVLEAFLEWQPTKVWIEGETLGRSVQDQFKDDLPIACLSTETKDKLTRAGKLIMKMERGEVFFPREETAWRPALEQELLAWTGHERQPADQIDAAAYAAMIATKDSHEPIRMSGAVVRA